MDSLVSDEQLERYFSEYGILAWSDHDANGVADAQVLADCKTYGTAFMVGRLAQRYTFPVLQQAVILVELTAVVVLRELTLRRGNGPPASLEMRYQEIVAPAGPLDQIAAGKLRLVDTNGNLLRMHQGSAPTHSNLEVDRRFSERRIRVVTGSSNNEPSRLRRDNDTRTERDQW